MLLVSFWASSNFVTLVNCFSYSHDQESRTHHLHMLKLPHRKDSNFIPSTHSYPLLCSIFHKVSPKILSNMGMNYALKKKEREGTWRPMKKNISHAHNISRERQNHGTPYPLAFHNIHHISTHMHFSIMVVWLAYSLGPIFDFAKYLRQVCLSFFSLPWAPPKSL